jgi:hypothetical protein
LEGGFVAQSPILWSVGDNIFAGKATAIYAAAPIAGLAQWFNGRGDRGWIFGYDPADISILYGAGNAIQLIVWLADEPDYAISAEFKDDLVTLVETFRGDGPHFGPMNVVLFTECETYNLAGTAYAVYQAQLMQAYLDCIGIVHDTYPAAKVGLGLGGYAWGDAPRDLSWCDAALQASDFTCFQLMHNYSYTVPGYTTPFGMVVRQAVNQLSSYGKPIAISHTKIWASDLNFAGAAARWGQAVVDLLAPATIADLTSKGLFAWNLMDDRYVNDPGSAFGATVEAITRTTAPATYFGRDSMASYSVTRSRHATLVANTVDACSFSTNIGEVEVLNRGANEIYFTCDGSVPTVGGLDTYIVPAGEALRVSSETDVINLISAGTPPYSVTGGF